jgi:ribosome-interacting GTPase 1
VNQHIGLRHPQILIKSSYHLGLLKAKLAKLRRELLAPTGGGGSGGAGVGFDVARTGIASVGFVGYAPSPQFYA